MPALACKMFLDMKNETFDDDPYDTRPHSDFVKNPCGGVDEPTVSWSSHTSYTPCAWDAAAPIPKHGTIINGTTSAELLQSAREVLTKG